MSPILGLVLLLPLAHPQGLQDAEDPRRELARARQEEREVLDQLAELQRQLAEVEQEVLELQARRTELEDRRARTRAALESARSDLQAEEARLAAHLRLLYQLQRRGIARILFSAQDPAELRRLSRYLVALVQGWRARHARFRDQVRRQAEIVERLEHDRAALEAVQAELRLRESELRDSRSRRLALLEEIRQRKDAALQLLARRARASQGFGAMVADDQGDPALGARFRAQGGRLPWPVQGPILRPFGRFVDPVTGQQERNPGIDIAAPFGTPFRAVADGRVQHTGYIEGFGLTVVLQHGPYTTVYAHAGRIQVAPGRTVSAGEVLGLVGETGVTDDRGPRLHFEVRYHQTPQDPLTWLGPRR